MSPRTSSRAIAPSFVASLAFHLAAAVVLAGLMTPVQLIRGHNYAPLAVQLVGTPVPPATTSPTAAETLLSTQAESVAVPAASVPEAPSPAVTPAPPASAAEAAPTPMEVRTDASSTSSPAGIVSVAEPPSGMAALPPDLVTRAQGAYMIEVEYPPRLVNMPDVVYPPAALESQRADSVIVWLAIDRNGAVEDTVFVAGLPGFIDAVGTALQSAKFLPAQERGEIIPYYLVLQFDFKATRASAASAASANAITPVK